MSFKAEAPKESEEEKRAREIAENRAESTRLEELSEQARTGTALLLRRFGVGRTAGRTGGSSPVPTIPGVFTSPGLASTFSGYSPLGAQAASRMQFPSLAPSGRQPL